ncbi:TetR/AcrR family transcriptional regulator [Mycobacterium sp. AZCC_0083]|uniref:TetR/AcrR family transcriptional regulator n=1 Tax=Mycobacterium sp. AZCC_0083 TaxID=2735882 RepID=UPI001614B5C7|nr:TetR/AcrR family transcriptional regulator [Mycobacterium sp. AZCC_0083]MBB5163979.1 AcrR family transcriptional regulator [Mycobacterium sp. AZCC_0083]
MTTKTSVRRAPAGAAVLQENVTEAIRAAVILDLAEVGYARLSIESVARRAGVGKTAVYRRWPSKQQMVVAVVSEVAGAAIPVIDTGSLVGDVRAFLYEAYDGLRLPMVRAILPDLFAEGTRSGELGEDLLARVRDPRRARAAEMIDRAVRRGELDPSVDVETALDVLAGPLYWRLAVIQTPEGAHYVERLTRVVVAGIQAASMSVLAAE